MTTRVLRAAFLCATLVSASTLACARVTPATDPSPASMASAEWRASLAMATQETLLGRYGVADHVLSDFAAHFPSTAEAAEATYWRALFKLDPANATGNPRESVALLDAYVATPFAAARRGEVQTLRRIASALELRSVPPPVATGSATMTLPGATTKAEDRARDEELQRLREELARANAELERIRRRLAQPKP